MVAAVTSVGPPPMTPASAIGPLSSVMSRSSGSSARSCPSSVVSRSPGRGAADDDLARQRVEVEGVQRLAELEHARGW